MFIPKKKCNIIPLPSLIEVLKNTVVESWLDKGPNDCFRYDNDTDYKDVWFISGDIGDFNYSARYSIDKRVSNSSTRYLKYCAVGDKNIKVGD